MPAPRMLCRAERSRRAPIASQGGEDPDIAHIRPGPQPHADCQLEMQQEKEEE